MAEQETSGTDYRLKEQHWRPDARRSRHGLRLLLQLESLECQSGQPERAEPAELSRELDAAQKELGTSLGDPRGPRKRSSARAQRMKHKRS